jgi:mono/diheme cytochrome c family protein
MKRFFVFLPLASFLLGCNQAPVAPPAPEEAAPQVLAAGQAVYNTSCTTCHQPDGYGVPNMQPALVDDDIVAGDPTQVIRVVLQGPAKVLPSGRPSYANVMPAFNQLTDEQIADVLSFIRHEYGHDASPISADEVKTVRSQFGS